MLRSRYRDRGGIAGSGTPTPSGVPEIVSTPVVTGIRWAGRTVTGSNGTWTNSPDSYAYQWYLDDVAITDEEAAEYLILSADEGDLTFGVVATNAFGSSDEAISDPVTIIHGLLVDLDASLPARLSGTTGFVEIWGDNSGNAIDATASANTSAQPQTGVNTLNGLNVLTWPDTNNRQMNFGGALAPLIGGSNNVTIFSVGNKADTSRAQDAFMADQTRFRNVLSSTGSFFRYTASNSASLSYTATTDYRILAGMRSGDTAYHWMGGGTPATTTAADTTMSQPRVAHTDARFHGNMAHNLIWGRALSAAELNYVGEVLSSKWSPSWTTATV